MDNAVIIPLYCENIKTVDLVSRLCALGADNIIVVNDGGRLSEEFRTSLMSMGCHFVEFSENQGKGKSIRAGLRYAHDKLYNIKGYITVDADGQHRAEDVMKVSRALELRPDTLILGKRDLKHSDVPVYMRFFKAVTSGYFKIITGVKCEDPLTGLRGIPACLYSLFIETKGDRYDYEMNCLTRCADRKVPIYTVTVLPRYFPNQPSNYNLFKDTYLIFITPLRFATASLGCSMIDILMFTLLTYLLPADMFLSVAIATILSRLVSGGINFAINRKVIFKDGGKASRQVRRYCILFFGIMLSSMTIVSLLSFIGIAVTLIKIAVDTLLWAVNYTLQRKWVFKKD